MRLLAGWPIRRLWALAIAESNTLALLFEAAFLPQDSHYYSCTLSASSLFANYRKITASYDCTLRVNTRLYSEHPYRNFLYFNSVLAIAPLSFICKMQ